MKQHDEVTDSGSVSLLFFIKEDQEKCHKSNVIKHTKREKECIIFSTMANPSN